MQLKKNVHFLLLLLLLFSAVALHKCSSGNGTKVWKRKRQREWTKNTCWRALNAERFLVIFFLQTNVIWKDKKNTHYYHWTFSSLNVKQNGDYSNNIEEGSRIVCLCKYHRILSRISADSYMHECISWLQRVWFAMPCPLMQFRCLSSCQGQLHCTRVSVCKAPQACPRLRILTINLVFASMYLYISRTYLLLFSIIALVACTGLLFNCIVNSKCNLLGFSIVCRAVIYWNQIVKWWYIYRAESLHKLAGQFEKLHATGCSKCLSIWRWIVEAHKQWMELMKWQINCYQFNLICNVVPI
jgi:hypothetical protein